MSAFDPKRTLPSLTKPLPARRFDPLRCLVLRGGEAGARHAQSDCSERLFSPDPLWRLGYQATRYAGSASRRGPLSRGVRARFATRTGVDGLRVPARADHTTLGTLAWISIGRVRAGVDSLHLRGRWACDAESDAGWHGVKACTRARHREGDGSYYPPPVSVGGSALGAGPPHRQR